MSSTELDWFKSSYSGTGGDNCVEIATRPDTVHVRDSKATRLGSLALSPTAWTAFTAYVSGSREEAL
ncbi:DUF397 domain-containing protein [Streptomyces sp. NBC_01317]|uniref:DUF397 domain-containing protein n=1 Tax=Streptomyces sp. NBC_01317 TaxID=2903822 RepID=UPI002E10A4B9|nr:DUF397 domain-containing protein [Streptomyces sp. NBC_01317]